MTQNIYDDPAFFARYSQLGRSVSGLDGAAEWPALRALLPDLRASRVLDLGCGYGWFCRWARERGAASVLGIDASKLMLQRAAADTNDPAIDYRRADLEEVALAAQSFDLAYSSLALHYVVALERLFLEVHRAVTPGGHFVMSVEHPIYTAPSEPKWLVGGAGRRVWPVDGYLIEGPRSTDWLVDGVIKQHRTIGTYVNLMLRAGFRLTHLQEWGPTDAQIEANPELRDERARPMFLLLAGRRV